MLEFDTGVRCGELPVGLGVVDVSIVLPSRDLVDEGLFVWDAPLEALGGRRVGTRPYRANMPCFGVWCHSNRSASRLAPAVGKAS
jgi:hypothetical protein